TCSMASVTSWSTPSRASSSICGDGSRAPSGMAGLPRYREPQERSLAVIDVAGFVADLKDHAVDHQFHVHDERHFVETYSLRQMWEVVLHPEDACGGPLDLPRTLEVDPRTFLGFEDRMLEVPEGADPPDGYAFPLI